MNAAAYHRSDRLEALNPFNQSRPRAPAPAPTEAPDLLSCSKSSSATAKQHVLQTRASLLRLRHRRWIGVSGMVAVAGTESRAYRFLLTGFRFSMNAAMPSERSSSAKVE